MIDFGTLSTQLRVIKTSPAWEVVRGAVDRLSGLDDKAPLLPDQSQDAEAVRAFAGLLRQDGDLIALALVCGAFVGQASTQLPAERLLIGLTAISQALRLKDKSDEVVREDLQRLTADVSSRFKLELSAQPIAPPGDVGALAAYKSELQQAIAGARAFSFESAREATRARAWPAAAERMKAFLTAATSSVPSPLPSVDEMLTLVAGTSPGSLVPFDLAEATIVHWSGVFDRASRGMRPPTDVEFAPPWLAAVSLAALGFWFKNPNELVQWLGSIPRASPEPGSSSTVDEIGNAFSAFHLIGSPRAERGVLVLYDQTRSLIADWKPSTRTASLCLTGGQLQTLAQADALRPPRLPESLLPRFDVVAVEDEGTDRSMTGEPLWTRLITSREVLGPQRTLGDVLGHSPTLVRFVRDRPRVPVPNVPLVPGPKSIDDLFPVDLTPQLAR
jgi:hypothetical protein